VKDFSYLYRGDDVITLSLKQINLPFERVTKLTNNHPCGGKRLSFSSLSKTKT
jgi:hypothetical protein